MLKPLQKRFEAWVAYRHGVVKTPVQLRRERIYILPTRYGYLFALMLVVMFLWSINYNNSMGFALTFLLVAVALNTLWRSHNTLLGLRVYPAQSKPVFAGQEALFIYNIENPDGRPRYGIALQRQQGACLYGDIPGSASREFPLTLSTERRGLLRPGRLQVMTRFPLGLFQAWSWIEFEQGCLVYPRPWGKRPLPLNKTLVSAMGDGGEQGTGSEDYAGLRGYVPGDSPRHVAWKASVRTGELVVKHFTDQNRSPLWLDWRFLEPATEEARLSQLCQWVLKAEAEGREYGLKIPDTELPPGRGEIHRRRCLEALALYRFPS
jgi:uncharacterized protein (DUF58 family)